MKYEKTTINLNSGIMKLIRTFFFTDELFFLKCVDADHVSKQSGLVIGVSKIIYVHIIVASVQVIMYCPVRM